MKRNNQPIFRMTASFQSKPSDLLCQFHPHSITTCSTSLNSIFQSTNQTATKNAMQFKSMALQRIPSKLPAFQGVKLREIYGDF